MKTAIQIRADSNKRILKYRDIAPGTVFCLQCQLKNPPDNRCYYIKTRGNPLSLVRFDIDPRNGEFNELEVVVVISEMIIRNPPPQEDYSDPDPPFDESELDESDRTFIQSIQAMYHSETRRTPFVPTLPLL